MRDVVLGLICGLIPGAFMAALCWYLLWEERRAKR